MPVYQGTGLADPIHTSEQKVLFANEQVFPGTASKALFFQKIRGNYYPPYIAFEVSYSGDPGVSEIDVQVADTDQNISYVSIMSLVNTALNSSFVGRIELTNFCARYVRVMQVTRTNNVNTTVLATR